MVVNHINLKQYLLDSSMTQNDRKFMLDILNTVDTTLIGKVMEYYERTTLKQAKASEKIFQLDPKMYKVFEKFHRDI